jgi:hypothetical protein
MGDGGHASVSGVWLCAVECVTKTVEKCVKTHRHRCLGVRTQPITIQSKGGRGAWEDGWRGERKVGGLVGGRQRTNRGAHGTTSSRRWGRNAKCNAHEHVRAGQLWAAMVTTSYRTGSTLMAMSGHELNKVCSLSLVWLAHRNTQPHTPRSLRASDVASFTHSLTCGRLGKLLRRRPVYRT